MLCAWEPLRYAGMGAELDAPFIQSHRMNEHSRCLPLRHASSTLRPPQPLHLEPKASRQHRHFLAKWLCLQAKTAISLLIPLERKKRFSDIQKTTSYFRISRPLSYQIKFRSWRVPPSGSDVGCCLGSRTLEKVQRGYGLLDRDCECRGSCSSGIHGGERCRAGGCKIGGRDGNR